ncbi:MAG TPA: hypothetical protein H9817_09875 [Candidatus Mediterraneibacter stercorigallinarum]|uniref:Uncharacterized protein n=1 Tax=Candidatus Mediterraneibacter stercorigallinarum TaxID=2838686 RepID=A0A9D2DC80_9FIRM|nr:hypothetical protein [Candidatus Mediterraneibacter stercorigallinarum]
MMKNEGAVVMADRIKKKFENILYYHKTKILAGAAAAALLIWGLFLYGGESLDTALYGEAVNVQISRENLDRICRMGIESLGKDPQREQILLETGTEIDADNPESSAISGGLEKMTTSIFAHEIDFMICTPEIMEYYAGKDALEEISPSDGYGIDITGTAFTDSEEKADRQIMFCIFKNSEHKEDARRFAESLLPSDREE